jgi:hypothetical protein
MTRQWVRVTSGKPGRGSVGYVERIWVNRGVPNTLIRFAMSFPYDFVSKRSGTFRFLSKAECAVMELTQPTYPA